jgi:hypothetical protein
VTVEWTPLRLSETTPDGYADSSKPVDELIQNYVKKLDDKLPVVVWICDIEDEKSNNKILGRVLCDEKVGLAMKRFVCLKAEIQSIPDERQADKLARKCPIFQFYDPAGNLFADLQGRRATSKGGFCSRVEKLWDVSFSVRLKEYVRDMSKILDKIDKIEGEKQRLERKLARAADNKRKYDALQKEREELLAKEAEIAEEEQETLEKVTLRPEFAENDESVKK